MKPPITGKSEMEVGGSISPVLQDFENPGENAFVGIQMANIHSENNYL